MSVIDLNKLYEDYFGLIESYFGGIRHYLSDDELNHVQLSNLIPQYPHLSDLMIDAIDGIGDDIFEFWQQHKNVYDIIAKQDGLKCLFSGEITPGAIENFIKRTALYVDTIIIPDPIFNLTLHKDKITNKKYYLKQLIRHTFNIYKVKELILADTTNKIVLILPVSLNTLSETVLEDLKKSAALKGGAYLSKLFCEDLNYISEGFDYLSRYGSYDEIFNAIQDKRNLPIQFQKKDDFLGFFHQFNSLKQKAYSDQSEVGEIFCSYIAGQFLRVQEHKIYCNKAMAEPIYNNTTPWFFFNYELGGQDIDASVINALNLKGFEWIGNIPISAIKILREEGKLDYMRDILRHGITSLKVKNDPNFQQTAKIISTNLEEAFLKQQAEISALRKEVGNIMKKDIPILTGSFLAGFIPVVGQIASFVSFGRDLPKLIETSMQKKAILKNKENDFISLLMQEYAGMNNS